MFWNSKPRQKTEEEDEEEGRIEEGQRIGRLIMPSWIQNRMNEIKTDNKWRRIIVADGYPRSVEDGWLDKLVSMSGNFDLALHIAPLETRRVIGMLNRELRKQGSDINTLT